MHIHSFGAEALRTLRRFGRHENGGFGTWFGLALVPILAGAGLAVDYSQVAAATSAAQIAADSAALAAASLFEARDRELRRIADKTAFENYSRFGDVLAMSDFSYDRDSGVVRVTVSGTIPLSFGPFVGVSTAAVSSTSEAVRGISGELEVALVLDNTWSMDAADSSGVRKIDALKSAALTLIDLVTQYDLAPVKIGVVPYAEYVNVGLSNRGRQWLDVPPNYNERTPRTCTTQTTRSVCTKTTSRTCTYSVDGTSQSYDCSDYSCTTTDVPPYEQCSGGGVIHYRWYGCVLSRVPRDLRLSDLEPLEPYVGTLATSQKCLTEIVPLTSSVNKVKRAIRDMAVSIDGYRPSTYIPAGIVWGVNVLSPSEPFAHGAAYDAANLMPRKVIVLMTDGENTLRFDPATGEHVGGDPATTNEDTMKTCGYAASQGIEIFSVAFGSLSAEAGRILSACASDAEHFFSAANAAELNATFEKIARSLMNVRLTE